MGRYSAVANQRGPNAPKQPHPIWNTLGCLMIIVVGVMSIGAGIYTIQFGLKAGWPIPPVLLQPIILPGWMYSIMPGLASLLLKVVSVDYLMAYAAASIVFMVLLGGLVSVFYAFLYRLTGPAKYGPLDAPYEKGQGGRYKR